MTSDVVQDIQNALRRIHFTDSRLPPLIINGLYDAATSDAVRIYQRTRGLTETGVTDSETFAVLMSEYNDLAAQKATPLSVFPDPFFRLKPGDRSDSVKIVQGVLSTLSAQYTNLPDVAVSGIYDSQTENAVRAVQQLLRTEQNGVLDVDTWNALARLYSSRPITGSERL